jgi:hypothetical protein
MVGVSVRTIDERVAFIEGRVTEFSSGIEGPAAADRGG